MNKAFTAWRVVSSQRAARILKKQAVITIDLGFSGSRSSCGIASSAHGVLTPGRLFTFGLAVRHVRKFVRAHPTCVLILEAPLSGTFRADGNPVPRGDFERGPRPRWWSINAGAAMCLAALFLLRRIIAPEEQKTHARISVIEGFVSRGRVPHAAVAEALRDAFIGTRACTWRRVTAPPGGEVLSILRVLKIHDESALPPVILAPLPL